MILSAAMEAGMASLNELQWRAAALAGGGLTPLGYQQIDSLNTVQSLTVPTGATMVLLHAEDEDVRWRDDGTNPTSSVGMVISAGDTFLYTGDLSAIRFIETAASAKLNASYY